MAFSISPGVTVTEFDGTTVSPAVSTTEGALGGVFRWGPVGQAVLVTNEDELVQRFGKPTNHNAETFFVGADFLSYTSALYVSRAANTTSEVNAVLSAVSNTGTVNAHSCVIKNDDDFEAKRSTLSANVQYIARCPGAMGNSLKISQCDSAAQYQSLISNTALFPANASINITSSAIVFAPGTTYAEFRAVAANSTITDSVVETYAQSAADVVANAMSTGDLLNISGDWLGFANVGAVEVVSTANGYVGTFRINLSSEYTRPTLTSVKDLPRYWEYYNVVSAPPGQSDYVAASGNTAAQDELHVVVVDAGGEFTGVPGSVLEVYQGLSRANDSKTQDGSNLFYKNVINEQSAFVWAASDRPNAVSTNALNVATSPNAKPLTSRMALGLDGLNETIADLGSLMDAYNLFKDPETLDVSIIMGGKAIGGSNSELLSKYIKDSIVGHRKDAMATFSPPRSAVVNNVGREATDVVAFRNAVGSSSFVIFDSGYKYRYDKYNDLYRYVPLNGDIAGLMARADQSSDPWFSPAGYTRGQLKNVVKLAFNPVAAERDVLYRNAVNPVVTFPGEGTILYGDKTGLAKPSSFDRINVRRLFNVLEKSISRAAKYSLFEFNDEFTRAQFRSMVEPFLRDVQGRRGIYQFKVVCDTTNNTPEVIDRNEFVGDIYVKPSRSTNFIRLNFVAVRTGVEFSEIVGQT